VVKEEKSTSSIRESGVGFVYYVLDDTLLSIFNWIMCFVYQRRNVDLSSPSHGKKGLRTRGFVRDFIRQMITFLHPEEDH